MAASMWVAGRAEGWEDCRECQAAWHRGMIRAHEQAIAFYRRQGFEADGVTPDARTDSGGRTSGANAARTAAATSMISAGVR